MKDDDYVQILGAQILQNEQALSALNVGVTVYNKAESTNVHNKIRSTTNHNQGNPNLRETAVAIL